MCSEFRKDTRMKVDCTNLRTNEKRKKQSKRRDSTHRIEMKPFASSQLILIYRILEKETSNEEHNLFEE